jgi:Protein of unknown function (DUF2568)
MSALRGITLGVRFLCELGMLAALAFWGALMGDGVGGAALALAAPIAAAGVWWAFVAPKARWPAPIVLAVLATVTSVLNAVQKRSGEAVPGAKGVD